jgi:vacuolar-type H+-ATPase subunit H
MNKQFPVGRVLVVSILVTYFLLGSLLTGGVAPSASVFLIVLVLWFSVYKLMHKGLGNRGLVTKMHDDLERVLEGIKERMAQQEVQRLATAEHEEQDRVEQARRRAEREERRASRPMRDPAVSKYADMIESKVREGGRAREGTEGQ